LHRWSFFEKEPPTATKNKFVTGGVCKRCKRLVSAKTGNTQGLVLHLKNYHQDDYETLLKLEKEEQEERRKMEKILSIETKKTETEVAIEKLVARAIEI
jgi:hypothetical protein